MTNKKFIGILFILIFLILFTRFYNLDSSATFFWDQARDLVKIHQYFLEKKITLIGPISEEGDRVFGSLTYYMLMPFAILGNFDPLSMALGAAFWGFLTALLILLLTRMVNKKLIIPIGLLLIIWFPLIETSRWAWNPNLIPFWIILGIIFFQYKKAFTFYLSGLTLGLALHHHFLAAFAVGMFVFLTTLLAIKQKTIQLHFYLISGLLTSILPFIIFDIRHSPGLFLTRFLYFNQTQEGLTLPIFFTQTWSNIKSVLFYYTHMSLLAILLGIFVLLVTIYDLRKKSPALVYVIPWFFQIMAIALIKNSFIHYFLPGLIFFIVWVISLRDGLGEWFSKAIIALLIFGSLFTIIPQLRTNPYVYQGWQPSIKTVREITKIAEEIIRKEKLESINIAVLGSQDPNTYGWKYRSLLLIKNIRLKSRDEYFTSDYLFIVSQSSEDEIRKDPASEMHNFRSGLLKGKWVVNGSGWMLYLFEKGKTV